MSCYTITRSLLHGIKSQKSYISKILMHFIGDNPYKVVLDKSGYILSLYEEVAMEDHVIYTWIDLMAKFPPTNFETINIHLDSSIDEEEAFLKVCRHTKNSQKLLIYSHQEWERFNYECESCICYDSVNIEVFDRDEAINELHPSQVGDTINVKNSNFANREGIVKNSKTK